MKRKDTRHGILLMEESVQEVGRLSLCEDRGMFTTRGTSTTYAPGQKKALRDNVPS